MALQMKPANTAGFSLEQSAATTQKHLEREVKARFHGRLDCIMGDCINGEGGYNEFNLSTEFSIIVML
jgi:hypothetical protein